MKKSKIVTILAVSALLTLSLAATSFAALGDKQVDLSVGLATESYSGSDTGFGLSVGGGVEMLKLSAIKGGTLQLRGDIGYNHWSSSAFGDDLTFSRIPVSVGARLYLPIDTKIRVYGETSLELSFDEFEFPAFNYGFGRFGGGSHSETNIGLTPGVGVEFAIARNILLGAGMKLHIIDGSYLNASVGVGYKF